MIGHLTKFALAVGLFLSQAALAAPDLKTMTGVWRGTIGDLPIQACYDAGEYSNDGKYFYQRRLSTIPLRADEKVPGEVTEGWADSKGVARWRIAAITKDRVEGVWTGNGRTLPISLARVPYAKTEEFDTACSSLVFVQPMLDATRIVKIAARVHAVPIEKWTLAYPDKSISVESFQLRGTGPAVAAINRRLRKPFDKSDEGWTWCLRTAGAWGGDYHDEVEARLVTTHWLSVMSSNDSFCGGAHPNNSNQPMLFDRQSGKLVDLYTWFGSASSNREKVEGYPETIDSLKGRLLDLVVKFHPRTGDKDDDCGDAVKSASSWSLELKAEGVSFTPDLTRAVMACGDEVVLPWAKLQPFLSPVGKREVAALLADRR